MATLALATTLSLGCSSSDKKTANEPAAPAPCSCGTVTAKEASTCTCADVNAKKAGWCEHCGTGYAEGQRTQCEKCARANKMCPNCEGGKPCADCSKKG
jgi:hypothetical protein